MLNSLIATLKSGFIRDTFALSASTAVAQLIALAILPILTRIYTPEHFGLFTLFIALFTYLCQLGALNLEQTVVLPDTDDKSDAIVAGILLLGLFVAVLSAGLVLVAGQTIAVQWLEQPDIQPWLILLPLAMLTMNAFLGCRFLLLRAKRFKRIGIAFVSGTTIGSLVSILCGLYLPEAYRAGGLMIGYTAQTTFLLLFVGSVIKRPLRILRGLRLAEIKAAIFPYRKLVVSGTVSRMITISYIRIPVFFISFVFGAGILGLYAMADRIVSAPRMLIADAIGDVYRQRASAQFNRDGRFDSTFIQTLGLLVAIGIPIHLVLIFISEPLFSFVLGEQWSEAGRYAAILFVGGMFAFIATPLDKGVMIRQKHGYLIGWPASRGILKLIGFAALYYGFGASIEAALWILVSVRVVMHLIDLYCEWVWSKGGNIFR